MSQEIACLEAEFSRVEAERESVSTELAKPRALRLLAARDIYDDLLTPCFLQSVLLQVEILLVRRDSGVTDARADRRSSKASCRL